MTTTHGPRNPRRVFLGVIGSVLACAALAVPAPGFGASTAQVTLPNQPLQIWFVRHAESEINVSGNPRPVPDGGVSYPLTKKGVGQALALADALADVPVTTIYTSTHLRAVQTADAVAFRHDLTLNLAPEAIEIDMGTRSGEDSRAIYIELARKWTVEKDLDARHGDGESLAEAQRRFLPVVREIMIRQGHDSGVVVIVAHAGTLGLLVPMLATNVPADFGVRHPLPNTGIIKTELRDSKLYCTEWAGIPSAQFAGE
jgi:2,3-bisphosphoglycerate-dependent phosphoglycerate mutase